MKKVTKINEKSTQIHTKKNISFCLKKIHDLDVFYTTNNQKYCWTNRKFNLKMILKLELVIWNEKILFTINSTSFPERILILTWFAKGVLTIYYVNHHNILFCKTLHREKNPRNSTCTKQFSEPLFLITQCKSSSYKSPKPLISLF